ncbi:hypothetical protein JYJ93_09180 [Corallococcus sp. NCSPR001]|uniref:hypothetical protein n=1 Tax=Corallococcus sp. NCSPR001 TaxID=2813576 RepID=UPI001A904760|nr:hypothetical protein [Corallococcus sp. NCSPR001]MBN9682596.1 hypothetical protein [Corallococcus sp. NCSPR001]
MTTPAASTNSTAPAAFSAATPQQTPPAYDLLPPSMNPPRNERLDTAVNDAVRRAAGENIPLPSPTERNELYALAQKMRNEGCCDVKEIENALVAKLREKVTGPSKPKTAAELDAVIDQAYKYVYFDDARPTSESEKAAFRELARELSDKGLGGKDLLYGLSEKIRQVKDWGGKPGEPAVIRSAIEKGFDRVFEGSRKPNAAEYAEFTKMAEDMAKSGSSSKDIMFAVAEKMRARQSTGGAPVNSPKVIDDVIDQAYKYVYNNESRPTTEAEKAEYRAMAKELAEKGAAPKDIMFAVAEKVRQIKDYGGKPEDPKAIKAAIDKAFARVFEKENRTATPAEYAEYSKLAQEMAKGGSASQAIMYAISEKLRSEKDFGKTPSPDGIVNMAFKDVLEGAYRPPKPREMEAWRRIAEEMLKAGKAPRDVLMEIRSQLRVAVYNR